MNFEEYDIGLRVKQCRIQVEVIFPRFGIFLNLKINHKTYVVLAMDILSSQDKEIASNNLDAGALFVLKSEGSWVHCGFHLTTSIVTPVLLSLPFGMSLLGWFPGLIVLIIVAGVTFYSYNLLSLVLEHQARLGRRQLRFRDMAADILGPAWGRFYVGPLQFGVCYGSVIACTLLGGQSLKFIYLLHKPEGSLKLYHFISMFGTVILILAQLPSFHSLRYINLVSLVLCLLFSAFATAGAIHIGSSPAAPSKDYTVIGSYKNRIFNSLNAISIISTAYASGIIPEIQATLKAPVKGKMFKGLCMCYGVVMATYFSVAVSGYWAFGSASKTSILLNFIADDGKPLLPIWFLLTTNVCTLTQVFGVTVVYLQPTNEIFEKLCSDPSKEQFCARNVIPRIISRSLSVITATLLAAAFPFFGDIVALLGALGFIPLDFILPMVFYIVALKSSKSSTVFLVNVVIVAGSSVLVLLAAVASLRQIFIDATTYKLFANV